jgi:hypothetical protein
MANICDVLMFDVVLPVQYRPSGYLKIWKESLKRRICQRVWPDVNQFGWGYMVK